MFESLQILQVSLLSIPILACLIIGVIILIKPVLVIHRRLFLIGFLPFLAANLLAIVEDLVMNGLVVLDWRVVLVLAADLILIGGSIWLLRGWIVFGSNAEQTQAVFISALQANGWRVDVVPGHKRSLWGGEREAVQLQAIRGEEQGLIWLLAQSGTVIIQVEKGLAQNKVREMFPALRRTEKVYRLQAHLPGILFLVLGVLLAVLVWIFFFEPRLILLE